MLAPNLFALFANGWSASCVSNDKNARSACLSPNLLVAQMNRTWLRLCVLGFAIFLFSLEICAAPTRTWETTLQWVHESFPNTRHLSTAQLAIKMQSRDTSLVPIIFDVRTQAEFSVSHLPLAVRAERLKQAMPYLLGQKKDRPIVVYCSVGYRSSQLAQDLAAEGFTQVHNLQGGIFTWANQNRMMENQHGLTKAMHPYNADWGQLLSIKIEQRKKP